MKIKNLLTLFISLVVFVLFQLTLTSVAYSAPKITSAPAFNPVDSIKNCKGEQWSVKNGYTAETWFSGGVKGEACLTTYGSKSFKIDWNILKYGFLHEVGLYGLHVPIDSMNNKATAKFKHAFSNITGTGGYTGLYGWCGKPGATDAIEFYINENWVGGTINMSSCVKMGTVTIDGATYDIYTRPVKDKTFAQWWSNRTSPRTKGKISYAKHFQAWRKLGMPNIVLTRLTYAFECTWGSETGGSLKYSSFSIGKP